MKVKVEIQHPNDELQDSKDKEEKI